MWAAKISTKIFVLRTCFRRDADHRKALSKFSSFNHASLFAILAVDGTVPFKRVRLGLIVSTLVIFTLYFYRQYTSFLYIGKPDDFLHLY